MIGRRLFSALIVFAVGGTLTLGGCGKRESEGTSVNQTPLVKVSTRLKWLPGALYLGSIAAKQNGYWSQQGLDVTVEPGGFEADPIKLVAAGSNDFGITGAEQLLQARANGVPIVAIYMELKDSPVGWMTLKSSGITSPQQFRGKRVGAWYGTNAEPTFDALMNKLGIETKSMTRVPIKFDMNPLYSGQVDVIPVYLNGHPLEARRNGKDVNTINPRDYGIRLYGNVYFTTERMIRERPDIVQKFVNGLARAWKETLADPESAVTTLLKAEPKLDRSLELEVLSVSRDFFTGGVPTERLGLMTLERWEEVKTVMSTYSDLPKTINLADAYTNKFVEAATP
jgi:ABC-type nitrate/sulfonate/bicarbonate transport system substrate-binding protein